MPAAGGPRLTDDFSSDASDELVPGRAPQAVKRKDWVGHGRWGSYHERHLAAAVMRAGKWNKRRRTMAQQREDLQLQVWEYEAPTQQYGNQWFRKVTWARMVRICFDHPTRRAHEAAISHDVSVKTVRLVRAFGACVYLLAQQAALNLLVLRAQASRPNFVVLRVAWDETGEQLTMRLKGVTAGQMQGTWHVMVARL